MYVGVNVVNHHDDYEILYARIRCSRHNLFENSMGGPEKGRGDMWKRTYARSPRIRRAS